MGDRLTEKRLGCFEYGLKDFKHKPGEFNDYDAFFAYNMAVRKLGKLEDREEEYDQLKQENAQLKEALQKCSPYQTAIMFTGIGEMQADICRFCGEEVHTRKCEYVRLTKESEGEG